MSFDRTYVLYVMIASVMFGIGLGIGLMTIFDPMPYSLTLATFCFALAGWSVVAAIRWGKRVKEQSDG